MDRLSYLIGFFAVFSLACSGEAPPPAPARGRVDAVAAAPTAAAPVGDFCEAHPSPAEAPTLVLPELDGTLAAPELQGRWTWVNVWATWCGPCVEEMPRLIGWPDKLRQEGADVQLIFLSTDLEASQLDVFRKRNAWAPPSLRMKAGGDAPTWVEGLGLGLAPVLPLHLFVNPEGKVVCARSGSVQSDAYASVKALVSAPR